MGYEILSGTVGYASQGSDFTNRVLPGGRTAVVQNQIYSFRLDGREITFKTRDFPSVANGDRVAVVGKVKGGTFQAVAIRNLTTQSDNYPGVGCAGVISWVMVAIGVLLFLITMPPAGPTMGLTYGSFAFIGIGGWLVSYIFSLKSAYRMLRNANFS